MAPKQKRININEENEDDDVIEVNGVKYAPIVSED